MFASGDPKKVPANTVMDVNRYQQDLAALSPGHQLSLLSLTAIDRRFGNGFLQTWTLGVERAFAGLTADVAYVGTAAFRLPRMFVSECVSGSGPGICAVHELRQQRSGDGRLRVRVGDDGYGALILQRLADFIVGKCWARWSGLAGWIHLGQIAGRCQRHYRRNGIDRRGVVVQPAGSVRYASGERSVELRCDARFHVERGAGFAPRAVWDFSRIERELLTKGLGVTEHLDHHQRFAVYGVLGNPADRRRGRSARIGRTRLANPTSRRAHSSTRPREDYFGRGRGQRKFLFHPDRDTGRHRAKLRALWNAGP